MGTAHGSGLSDTFARLPENTCKRRPARSMRGAQGHDWPDLEVLRASGLAVAPSDAHIDPVLTRADHALYAAKRAGRNRVARDVS